MQDDPAWLTLYNPLRVIGLAEKHPEKAELVKLRYFAGLTTAEAASVLGISRATAARYWTYAKTWLYCAMEDAGHV